MNRGDRPTELLGDLRRADTGIGHRRRLVRALTSETSGFLGLLIPLAGVMLAGVAAALVADLDGGLRGLLLVASGLPCAGLTWLIIWVIKNPLFAAPLRSDPADFDDRLNA